MYLLLWTSEHDHILGPILLLEMESTESKCFLFTQATCLLNILTVKRNFLEKLDKRDTMKCCDEYSWYLAGVVVCIALSLSEETSELYLESDPDLSQNLTDCSSS